MIEKQWVWVFHIRGAVSRQYPKDEVEEIYSYPAANPMVVEIVMKNEQKHYYPISTLESWHLTEIPVNIDSSKWERKERDRY